MNNRFFLAAGAILVASLTACSGTGSALPPTSIPLFNPQGAPAQTRVAPTAVIPARAPADTGLSGKLVYVQGKAGIAVLDLKTGNLSYLFQPPKDGLVSAASLSPDGKWIVMSYSPPPDPNKPQLGYTRLFIMPADGSSDPQPLLKPADETGLLYTLPTWSADGKSIIFGYFSPKDATDKATGFSLQRIVYPDGHPEKLVDNAFQPRLSPDGAHMVYVGQTDPTTPINELYISAADGSNPVKLLPNDAQLWTIDAPVFSRDGKTIIFSGVTNQPKVSLNWLDALLGLRVASAHNIPSDLWSIPAAGGTPTQLTHVGDTGIFPDTSPDDKHIAYLSFNGLFVMDPDGQNLVQISILGGAGTLQWVP